MNSVTSLINILTGPALFIRHDEYISELASLVPFFITKQELPESNYEKISRKKLKELDIEGSIKVTDEYTSTELDTNTLAYHHVFGTITSESNWRFSTKGLQKNLFAAEANENISGHFLHISSGGGQAWYLEQLAETLRSLEKPVHAFIERVCASAAYYIASQSDFISAATPFDVIGSIGVMTSYMDLTPMLEKWGIKFIEEYGTNSDLKNKKYNDLRTGKPEQYIKEELDPIRDRFVSDVKLGRSEIAKLPDDHPILRGETFYANIATKNGLIDSVENFSVALKRTHDAAIAWSNKKNDRKKALQILNQ